MTTLKHTKTNKEVFAFCFNVFLVLLEIVAIILLFTVPLVWKTGDPARVGNWTSFKYFTVDSNILLMISCIVSMTYILLLWNNKINKIPESEYIFKLITVACVALTMLTVFFVLTPGSIFLKDKTMPIETIYNGTNLFMHVVCPAVAIIMFLLFENRKDVKLIKTLYSLIVVVIYCIFYLSVAYTHVGPDGKIPFEYDWYFFCHFGKVATPFIAIGMMGFYYLIVWLTWFGNRKIDIKSIR